MSGSRGPWAMGGMGMLSSGPMGQWDSGPSGSNGCGEKVWGMLNKAFGNFMSNYRELEFPLEPLNWTGGGPFCDATLYVTPHLKVYGLDSASISDFSCTKPEFPRQAGFGGSGWNRRNVTLVVNISFARVLKIEGTSEVTGTWCGYDDSYNTAPISVDIVAPSANATLSWEVGQLFVEGNLPKVESAGFSWERTDNWKCGFGRENAEVGSLVKQAADFFNLACHKMLFQIESNIRHDLQVAMNRALEKVLKTVTG